jgi:hypothetical protein
VPQYAGGVPAPGAALVGLSRAALHACIALANRRGADTPVLATNETIARANAMALIADLAGDMFTRLRDG